MNAKVIMIMALTRGRDLGAVDIFTFPPLNVNWTFRSDPLPPALLNVHLKFCCPKSHFIPVGCTLYVKMSTAATQFTAFFKMW